MKGHATNRARACLNYSGTASNNGDAVVVVTQEQLLSTNDVAEDLADYTCMPILEADYASGSNNKQEDPHRSGPI
jgi:hypothetical protein